MSLGTPESTTTATRLPYKTLCRSWQPRQMPELAAQLKARGLQMTPEDLSNLAAKPLDAVISLGGCTASFVSPKGLVITNHHCVYGAVAYNSTPENELLANGFVAGDFAGELPADPNARRPVTQAIPDRREGSRCGKDVSRRCRFRGGRNH